MSFNWNNVGVEPSSEKKQSGYAAGEKLPAGHLNWFISQLSNLLNIAPEIEIEEIFSGSVKTNSDSATYTYNLSKSIYNFDYIVASGNPQYGAIKDYTTYGVVNVEFLKNLINNGSKPFIAISGTSSILTSYIQLNTDNTFCSLVETPLKIFGIKNKLNIQEG